MNKDILDKIDEIINIIENSDDYKKYLSLKESIKNNKELTTLINKVRILQQDYLHKRINKTLLDEKTKELNNNPLYREYINTLSEINNIYGIIETSLNNYFQEKLN